MASFVLSFFPLNVLDGIWDLIESVSEGFLTYSFIMTSGLRQYTAKYIVAIYLELSSQTSHYIHKCIRMSIIRRRFTCCNFFLLDLVCL